MKHRWTLLLLALWISSPLQAQDRDEDIFGAEAEPTKIDPAKFERLTEDPLQIGGLLYLRLDGTFVDSNDLSDQDLSIPSFADIYLDGRPNDRLRGFIRGRLSWNPTVDESDLPWFGLGPPQKQVNVLLDEFWMKFDLGRTVFVTLGKAHIRWGATRIWNPVDVINSSRRAPLAFFDARTGIPQIKLHLPVESLGWNFYLLGTLDEQDPFGNAGIAGRAEFVFSTVELGLLGSFHRSDEPRAGVDISAGILDLDVTGEVGLRFAETTPTVQASAGLEYGISIFDDDALYLGVEYFYNQQGSDTLEDAFLGAAGVSNAGELAEGVVDGSIDLNDVVSAIQFFYVGEQYGAFFLALPYPGTWNDTSFALSTVANLSDYSALSRLDITTRFLTYLTVQFYVMGHWGNEGELRVGPSTLNALQDWTTTDPHTQLLEAGLHLRLDL